MIVICIPFYFVWPVVVGYLHAPNNYLIIKLFVGCRRIYILYVEHVRQKMKFHIMFIVSFVNYQLVLW